NAKEGGGLIPTLLFGIPGSGSMAVFLGGMVLIGLEPGPAMVGAELQTTYTVVWSLALANVIGAGTCLLISKHVAYLTTIRYALMAPFMVMVICFAAFQATRDLGDLAALFAVGMLGVLMKRFGWPRPAFLIGFVLAGGMETYLYQAVQFDGWGFLIKPGVLIIGGLTAASIYFGVKFGHTSEAEEESEHRAHPRHSDKLTLQTVFAGLIVLLFAYGLYDAFQQSFLGGVFPGGVCALMLVFASIVFYKLVTGQVNDAANFDNEVEAGYVDNPEVAPMKEYIFWLAGFLVAAYLVGYLIAIALFFLLFLRVKAQSSWGQTALLTAIAAGFLTTLAHVMVLDFPRGLLQDAVALPWPIG
ncbi:MAG: tripartite tricarboxylate transporter permease, partial [Rhodobacteraceae bacterium]|nr:tripartite tricarboxylate transporter permease [Paracoccaceae bacterium]